MAILSKITAMFSGGKKEAPSADPVAYKNYTIVAQPIKEGSQYRTAGYIRSDSGTDADADVEVKQVQFIRADVNGDFDSAVEHSVQKAKQIIDEQGARMFERDIA